MTGTISGERTIAELVAAATPRPDDAQRTFRAVLDALSRPGTVSQLPPSPMWTPAVLLPMLALADLGTGVHVLHDDPRWAEVVRVVTDAPQVPIERARLVAAANPVDAAVLTELSRGSSAAPENGALACLEVSEVDASGQAWRLSGPGVPGELVVAPEGVPDGVLRARAQAVAAYPAGIDVLLVAPDGRMLGLPRTTIVEED